MTVAGGRRFYAWDDEDIEQSFDIASDDLNAYVASPYRFEHAAATLESVERYIQKV
jgi:hypothetical protein